MDLFRSQPHLCSLFLSLLQEWGAETLDWSLLRDEIFVDRFLRRLLLTQPLDEPAMFEACRSLLQPSVGGLLVAPILVRGGHFEGAEMDSFVQFAVRGRADSWDPMTWPELLTVLEEVAFAAVAPQGGSYFLASMLANGWVPQALRGRFSKRIGETCRLPLAEKKVYFAWLSGESPWADEHLQGEWRGPQTLSGLRLSGSLRSQVTPYSDRRRGISTERKKAPYLMSSR